MASPNEYGRKAIGFLDGVDVGLLTVDNVSSGSAQRLLDTAFEPR